MKEKGREADLAVVPAVAIPQLRRSAMNAAVVSAVSMPQLRRPCLRDDSERPRADVSSSEK